LEAVVLADLESLLTALYVELDDRISPLLRLARRGPASRYRRRTRSWSAWV
jgi:hypothetical protein